MNCHWFCDGYRANIFAQHKQMILFRTTKSRICRHGIIHEHDKGSTDGIVMQTYKHSCDSRIFREKKKPTKSQPITIEIRVEWAK